MDSAKVEIVAKNIWIPYTVQQSTTQKMHRMQEMPSCICLQSTALFFICIITKGIRLTKSQKWLGLHNQMCRFASCAEEKC